MRASTGEKMSTSNEIPYEYYLLLCQPTQLQCGILASFFFASCFFLFSFFHLMSGLFALRHRNKNSITDADTQSVFDFDVCSWFLQEEKASNLFLIPLCNHSQDGPFLRREERERERGGEVRARGRGREKKWNYLDSLGFV